MGPSKPVRLNNGTIIAKGTANELKAQVGGERVEVVLVDGEQIDRAGALLEPLSVGQIELDHRTRKIVCPSRGGSKKVIAAAQILDDHEIEVEDIALRRPSLDDVFLKLTGHRAEEIPSEDGDTA